MTLMDSLKARLEDAKSKLDLLEVLYANGHLEKSVFLSERKKLQNDIKRNENILRKSG